METQDAGNAEEGCEDIRNDVEGVVQVDREEVFVVGGDEVVSSPKTEDLLRFRRAEVGEEG